MLLIAALVVICLGVTVALARSVPQQIGVAAHDDAALLWVVRHRPGWVNAVAHRVERLGRVYVVVVIAVVLGVLMRWRRAPWVVAAAPAAALVVSAVLVHWVKEMVGPARPALDALIHEAVPAFPSGHTATVTAVLLTAALLTIWAHLVPPRWHPWLLGVAIGLSVAVGYSRVAIQAHWVTDVVGGFALGTGVALVVSTVAAWAGRLPVAGCDGPVLASALGHHDHGGAERGPRSADLIEPTPRE